MWFENDMKKPEVVIEKEIRRVNDGSKWILECVLNSSVNSNIFHQHPVPRNKKEILIPVPTFNFLMR